MISSPSCFFLELFGDGACDSSFLFLRRFPFKFVWGESLLSKKSISKFVWGRRLRFFVFEKDYLQLCLGTVLAIRRFGRRLCPNLFGDGACDSLVLKKIHSTFVWGRCLRLSVFEKDYLQNCLGTVLAVRDFWGRLYPNLLGDVACVSLLFLKKIISKFVWGRCLRFVVFEKVSVQICLGTVLAILCFWILKKWCPSSFGDGACDSLLLKRFPFKFVLGRCLRFFVLCFCRRLSPSLFGDGACDSSLSRSVPSKFVWGRCLRFFVFEKGYLQLCLGTVLAIRRFWRRLCPSLFGDGACDYTFLRRVKSKFVWGRC